jgi:hypothetical protein
MALTIRGGVCGHDEGVPQSAGLDQPRCLRAGRLFHEAGDAPHAALEFGAGNDVAEIRIGFLRRNAEQQYLPGDPQFANRPAQCGGKHRLVIDVMIRGQQHDARQRIAPHDVQQRQQDAVRRPAVARLHDDVRTLRRRQRRLPPAPVLLGHDRADAVRRGDDRGALERAAQQRGAAVQGTKLLRHRYAGFVGGQLMQAAAFARRQDHDPGVHRRRAPLVVYFTHIGYQSSITDLL